MSSVLKYYLVAFLFIDVKQHSWEAGLCTYSVKRTMHTRRHNFSYI